MSRFFLIIIITIFYSCGNGKYETSTPIELQIEEDTTIFVVDSISIEDSLIYIQGEISQKDTVDFAISDTVNKSYKYEQMITNTHRDLDTINANLDSIKKVLKKKFRKYHKK